MFILPPRHPDKHTIQFCARWTLAVLEPFHVSLEVCIW